jgi:hypothetical protein
MGFTRFGNIVALMGALVLIAHATLAARRAHSIVPSSPR